MTKAKSEALGKWAETDVFTMQLVAIHPDFQHRRLGLALVEESLKRVRILISFSFMLNLL